MVPSCLSAAAQGRYDFGARIIRLEESVQRGQDSSAGWHRNDPNGSKPCLTCSIKSLNNLYRKVKIQLAVIAVTRSPGSAGFQPAQNAAGFQPAQNAARMAALPGDVSYGELQTEWGRTIGRRVGL